MSGVAARRRMNLMTALRAAGFAPVLRQSDQPDAEDDAIAFEAYPAINVQVCAFTGTPVNVTVVSGAGADVQFAFYDAETIPAAVAMVRARAAETA